MLGNGWGDFDRGRSCKKRSLTRLFIQNFIEIDPAGRMKSEHIQTSAQTDEHKMIDAFFTKNRSDHFFGILAKMQF